MCECGCGEFIPEKVFRVGNRILALQVYPGCEDCGTGFGVDLQIFSLSEAKERHIISTENFEPDKFGWNQMFFPILGKEDLVEVAKLIEKTDGEPFENYDNMIEFLEEKGLDLLQKAFHIRQRISQNESDK